MDTNREKKAWREVKYKERFENAGRGLRVFSQATRHLSVYATVSLLVVVAGLYFEISGVEWSLLVFSMGLVVISEAFNTAIEIDIDLTSPEYHPFARDTKDVAAGAVLLSAITAAIVGLIVFLPKFFNVI